jgi:hypothetical protein
MTTTLPATESQSRLLGCLWLGPGLDEGRLSEAGGIHFHDAVGDDSGVTLAFRSLGDLDAVIGELSAVRYQVASQLLAAESARQDPTIEPDAGPCDNGCGGRAISAANGRCRDCDEMASRR